MADEHVDEVADAVVVGGGIAGLSHAYALALRGQQVRVLEREAEFAEVGAGLQMAPNATRILDQWGLLEQVKAAGVMPRRLVFKDAVDGTELTHLPLDDGFVERFGAPYVVIHRSDLLEILYEACVKIGVELVPSSQVTSVETVDDGVVVTTADGRRDRGRVAIGADGLHSRLRASLSDDQAIDSGYVAYRGAFPVEEIGTEIDTESLDEVVVYFGAGCHLVRYALRGGQMINTVAVFRSPAFLRGETEWGGPEELEGAFAGACPEVAQALASLWRTRRWAMCDREPISTWVEDRLVLTGDAAHPMLQYLAQGACQAIEDAHTLAEVAPGPADVAWKPALVHFESVRTRRTAEVQRKARVWGDIWHVDGVARLLRNELFAQREPDDFSYVDWLYGR